MQEAFPRLPVSGIQAHIYHPGLRFNISSSLGHPATVIEAYQGRADLHKLPAKVDLGSPVIPLPGLPNRCLLARRSRTKANLWRSLLEDILNGKAEFEPGNEDIAKAVGSLIEAIQAWQCMDSSHHVMLTNPFGAPFVYVSSSCSHCLC